METAASCRLRARAYVPSDRPAWDAFVRDARNGVFLFERGYMDYHADRFADASMLVHDESGALLALLPAHRRGGDTVVSHGGLSFGGLVMQRRSGAAVVLDAFDALRRAWREQGIARLHYRPVPHIFHRLPAEDDLYALHTLGARTVRVDVSTTIDLARRPPLAKGRRHALAKARRAGVEVGSDVELSRFWPLLERVLALRHGVAPVHSLAEMTLLRERFPRQIVFCAAQAAGELLAGAVAYRYDGVLHTQYLAAGDAGRAHGALDAVVEHLIANFGGGCRWLNFGVSTTDEGRALNLGLAAQKEMFGGRSTVLQTLELDLAS